MLEILDKLYTGVIYDTLRDMGVTNCVINHAIKPVYPVKKLYGYIWTCEGSYSNDVSMDESLSSWSKMLSNAPSDHVVICSSNNTSNNEINFPEVSHMGELSAEVLKNKNVKGFVTDGGTRDVEFLEKINLPVFCTYATPKDIVGNWKIINEGKKITINSSSLNNTIPQTVEINTGDIFIYDSDGIVIIPSKLFQEVTNLALNKTTKETNMRESILNGMDPHEAYKKYGIF